MTAPSIKEALELKPCPFCGETPAFGRMIEPEHVTIGCNNDGCLVQLCVVSEIEQDAIAAWNTRATLSPLAGERREAIARLIEDVDVGTEPSTVYCRGVGEVLIIRLDSDSRARVVDAILASGLVQNEEGWQPISTAPKDMTEIIVLCGPKDVRLGWYFAPSSTTFGWFDQHQKPIKPTKWMPLPPIRSARDGSTET